jgi:hypothetical protein
MTFLVRKLRHQHWISVGDIQFTYEYLDREEGQPVAMIVVSDPSQKGRGRLRPVFLGMSDEQEIAPGIKIKLSSQQKPQASAIQIAIHAPGMPITRGFIWQRKPRLVVDNEQISL